MTDDTADKWNRRYRDADTGPGTVTPVLGENAHLLPRSGRALDLASGLGADALYLAAMGLDTAAWDISGEAIQQLRSEAERRELRIDARVRDCIADPPPPLSFDVIVVARFLDRALASPIMEALRPGGVLFYQTFAAEAVTDEGPRRAAFRLRDNELLHLFAPLRLLVYREEGRVGDITTGFRDAAMLVGVKRS